MPGPAWPLVRIGHWLRRRAEDIVVLLLASMFFSFLVQIVFRYILNLPLGWTVEWVTIAWLWGILFGYAFVVRGTDIIRLDLLYNIVPQPLQRGMDVVANLACAGILAWSLPKTFEFVTFMAVERTSYMLVPFDLVFAIYVPFVVAVIARSLFIVWQAVRGIDPHVARSRESKEDDRG